MTLLDLREALEGSWDEDTTYCPEQYYGEDPAFGQCAVTSLLIKEKFGGELKKGIVLVGRKQTEILHFWNELNDIPTDLTWRQFPAGSKVTKIESATEEELMSNTWFTRRYFILRNRVNEYLDKDKK